MKSQPQIEEGRIRFSGLSSESFELSNVGDTIVLTIRGRVKKVIEEEQASEGTRHVMNLSIEKVLTGVNSKINEGANEPTLFDQPENEGEAPEPEDAPALDEPNTTDADDENASDEPSTPELEGAPEIKDAVSDPTPITRPRRGKKSAEPTEPVFEGGPEFSA